MHRNMVGRSILGALACLVVFPVVVAAQSSLVGLVRDESGGVLPGVTVEAASPVLIEKVRSGVTDEQGRYRIVDLRPGVYRLNFTLTGFSTFVRDGVEVPSSVTVTINADLKVGSLQETVTVSGESPMVDIQQAQRTQVVTRDIMDALPTTRHIMSIGMLVPGVRNQRPDVGGSMQMEQVYPTTHGSGRHDASQSVDGANTLAINLQADYIDDAMTAETQVTTSALPAEVRSGGIYINVIPKDGGNIVSGSVFLGGTDGKWQSDNIDDYLRSRNMASANSMAHIQTFNGSIGGPVKRDTLWFLVVARHVSNDQGIANTPKEVVLPDGTTMRSILDSYLRDAALRLTWQATGKNKLAAWWQRTMKNKMNELFYGQDPRRGDARRAKNGNYAVGSVKYTGTLTSNLLLEASWLRSDMIYTTNRQLGYGPDTFAPYTKGWYEWAQKNDTALNKNFPLQCAFAAGCTSWGGGSNSRTGGHHFGTNTAASYVTGTHNLKTGFQVEYGWNLNQGLRNADLIQNYVNNRPQTVTVYNTPYESKNVLDYDLGIYVQDTWTIKRLTLNPGLRLEYFRSSNAETSMGAGRFAPARWFAEQPDLPNWGPDWAPRFAVAFDLFGDGRTAIKASANKYIKQEMVRVASRYGNGTSSTDSRAWFDADLIPGTSNISGVVLPTNNDGLAQDNEIGPTSSTTFGQRSDRNPAPDLGRAVNYEYTVSIQHQLMQGLALTGGWYKRTHKNLEILDRSLVTLTDYTSFTTRMPDFSNDPTLAGVLDPNEVLTIYNLKSAKRSVWGAAQIDRNSEDLSLYQGFDVSFRMQLWNANLSGGFTVDRNLSVFCALDDDPNGAMTTDLVQAWPVSTGGRFCDMRDFDVPYQKEFKLTGSTPLPYGLSVGVVLQSLPGWERVVTWSPAASLFPGGRTNAETIRLNRPGSVYMPRYQQLDLNFRKVFRSGNKRYSLQVDLFNALNSNAVFTSNDTVGASLGNATVIMTARTPRIAFQFQF